MLVKIVNGSLLKLDCEFYSLIDSKGSTIETSFCVGNTGETGVGKTKEPFMFAGSCANVASVPRVDMTLAWTMWLGSI